jgi:RNA polymerase sigma-70 factor (ECF subfamily)
MQIAYTSSSTSTSKTSTPPDTSVIAQISDEALVESIAEGDRRALETLYMRHHVRLYRLLLRRIGRESVAEEMVNEVFLEVWRNAHRFEAKARVATWLIAIARYKALTELRRRTETQLDDRVAAAIEDPADGPATTVERQNRRVILHRCLAKLSPQHREVIHLVYYQEKKIEEVARFIGAPINTIKTRIILCEKPHGAATGGGRRRQSLGGDLALPHSLISRMRKM